MGRDLGFVGVGLIDEIHNARAEDLAVGEFERVLIDSIGEKSLAMPNHNWVNHEMKFIKQAVVQQRLNQRTTARNRNVLAGLLLQFGDFGLNVTSNEC